MYSVSYALQLIVRFFNRFDSNPLLFTGKLTNSLKQTPVLYCMFKVQCVHVLFVVELSWFHMKDCSLLGKVNQVSENYQLNRPYD